MLYPILSMFALAIILGVTLISYILRDRKTPRGIMVLHGLFAVVPLVLLVMYAINEPGPVESIVLFIIAELGGIVMLTKDVLGRTIPKWLAVLHGALAMGGFVFLILFAMSGNEFPHL